MGEEEWIRDEILRETAPADPGGSTWNLVTRCLGRDVPRGTRSLPDAEAAENRAEQVVSAHFAHDHAEGDVREAEIFRH